MGSIFSLIAVIVLILIAYAGVTAANLHYLFGVVMPYAAVAVFLTGFIYRILKWASVPVPFRIPTTCGQQKSLPWIKHNKIENPPSPFWVVVRMAIEVLFFRSLFRNLKTQLTDGSRLVYGEAKWLWLAGLAFHWSLLIVLIRHSRFFFDPVPSFLHILEQFDGFLQIGAPVLFVTGVVLLISVAYLLIRRFFIPIVRYISLPADYFPLFLILAIAITGIEMRYFTKTHIVGVKELVMGLSTFSPRIPEGIGWIFYVHIFLVSVLFIYFPFSKLMHMGGVFMSPTRNMANNSRVKRHINPWNYPVKLHTYEEYENDFRDKMKSAGIPVEKE